MLWLFLYAQFDNRYNGKTKKTLQIIVISIYTSKKSNF